MNINILTSQLQRVWGPAVAYNFFYGGLGGSLYMLDMAFNEDFGKQALVLMILSPLIVMLGFTMVMIESPRPMRGIYILKNLSSSWMSREALVGMMFITLAIINIFIYDIVFYFLALAFGLLLIITQALIVYKCKAVTAWHNKTVPVLFITSSFTNGTGLILLISAFGFYELTDASLVLMVVIVTLNLIVWLVFLSFVKSNCQPIIIKTLGSTRNTIVQIVIGHILPMAVLLHFISTVYDAGNDFLMTESAFAGVCILISGIKRKRNIVIDAGYTRSLKLNIGN